MRASTEKFPFEFSRHSFAGKVSKRVCYRSNTSPQDVIFEEHTVGQEKISQGAKTGQQKSDMIVPRS